MAALDFDCQQSALAKKSKPAGKNSKKSGSSKTRPSINKNRKSDRKRDTKHGKKEKTKKENSKKGKHKAESHTKKASAHHHAEPAGIEPVLSEEEKAEIALRQSNYSLQSSAYSLLDQGVASRLSGDIDQAVNRLSESSSMFTDARRFQRNRVPGTLELFAEFELAQAYEAKNPPDWKSARDSYGRCIRANPSFVPGHLKLICLLATHGQMPLALSKAKDAVSSNPKDAILRFLLSLLYEKAGRDSDARREKKIALDLNRINKDDYKNREPMTEPTAAEYDKPGQSEFEDESMFEDKSASQEKDEDEEDSD